MSEWTKPKLEQMIADGVEENLTLDYKRVDSLIKSDGKKAELVRDISAFANSSGGVLIYGIAEPDDKAKRHLPERLDPINREEISKEWIEQVIQTIQPRVEGIVIHPVTINEPQSLVCYVVEVPQSHTAHQARDHIYYKRHNFNNLPMEDYEIRDVMNRKTHPRVSVSAKFVVFPRLNEDGAAGALNFSINNESDLLARYVSIIVNAPIRIHGKLIAYKEAIHDRSEEGESYRLTFSNHLGAPLFPHAGLQARFYFHLVDRMSPEPKKQLDDFRYVVFADSMPRLTGSFALDEIYCKIG